MSTDAVKASINAANRVFEQAFARGDAAGVASCYTAVGRVLPPNGQMATGRQAIQSFWQAVMAAGVKGVKLNTLEVEAHGDTAWEGGQADLLGDNNRLLDTVKYIVVWKEENGVWRLHRDIWNSSSAA
jgi:uncharacterized protein (TIGR02246 family)